MTTLQEGIGQALRNAKQMLEVYTPKEPEQNRALYGVIATMRAAFRKYDPNADTVKIDPVTLARVRVRCWLAHVLANLPRWPRLPRLPELPDFTWKLAALVIVLQLATSIVLSFVVSILFSKG